MVETDSSSNKEEQVEQNILDLWENQSGGGQPSEENRILELWHKFSDNFRKEAEQIKKSNADTKREAKNLKSKIDALEKNIESSNTRSFAVLAIFATVLSFISINVTGLQNISSFFEAAMIMTLNAFLSCIIISVPLIILEAFNKEEFPSNFVTILWKIFFTTIGLLAIFSFFSWMNDFSINISPKEGNSTSKIQSDQTSPSSSKS